MSNVAEEEPMSAHEKARIMARIQSAGSKGAKVTYAYYKKKTTLGSDMDTYLTWGDAILHMPVDLLVLLVPRTSNGTSQVLLVGFDGKLLPDNPMEMFSSRPAIERWWFAEDPIPAGIELSDGRGTIFRSLE